MSENNVEEQVREFYDNVGWVQDNSGQIGEDIYFRDYKDGRGDYRKKLILQPANEFKELTGILLIVGCGDLPVSHLYATEGFDKVVCIDISQQALELTRKKLGAKGVYYKGSARSLPLPDGSVNAVLSAHMLYHIDRADQETAVNEMIRVTKENGRILIVYVNPNSPLMSIQRLLKGIGVNKILGKARLYFYAYPLKWWDNFRDRSAVTILPNNAISTNQANALLPTIGLRKKFFQWVSKFEEKNPERAVKLWSYVTVRLDKLTSERQNPNT